MSISLSEYIFWVGVNDYETDLFEALWPLPNGISYNSFIIVDEKIAIIDAVKKGFNSEFVYKLKQVLPPNRSIDYLIINHIEPDHSGAIECLIAHFPNITIVGNAKTIELLNDFYKVGNKVHIIKDNDVLKLGRHSLKFFITPMVHWPETMITYEESTQTLFSGDVFGGFGVLQGIFDDQADLPLFIEETRRYFSNIIGKYSPMVQKAIAKIKTVPIRIVAPTHGPIFRKNPSTIIDYYDRWSRYDVEQGAVIVCGSMYGNTQKMADVIGQGVCDNGIKNIKMFNITHSHISYIINEIWRYRALVVGSCTYNTKLFPPIEQLLSALDNDKIKEHILGIFGSYSWSGGALDGLKKFAQNPDWKLIEPVVEAKCHPTDDQLKQCYELGKNVALELLKVQST